MECRRLFESATDATSITCKLLLLIWYFIHFTFRNPYEERTAHAYHVYSGTGHGSWGYSGMVS